MAAVLVVVLLLLSWSLFGDKIVAKITPADDGNTPGVQDDVNTPDDSNTNTDDPNANNGDTTDPNTGDEPNANDPANGSNTTAANPGTTTTPSTPTVDASALSIKTNVGTTLPKDGNGNFDCTIKSSETIRLSVSGRPSSVTTSPSVTLLMGVEQARHALPFSSTRQAPQAAWPEQPSLAAVRRRSLRR